MLMSAMIFSRLITPAWMLFGERMTSCSTPSMRNRTRRSCSVGSTWMSEARSWTACVISRLTNLTIGASSTSSVTLLEVVDLVVGGRRHRQVVELAVGAVEAVDRADDVGPRRDDRLDLGAGERADVVDREDVRRVGHRDDELAVLEADRQRRVAAANRLGHERDRRAVDRELGEVDESKADLGGERRDELGLGQHALVDEHAAEAATAALVLLVRGRQLGPVTRPPSSRMSPSCFIRALPQEWWPLPVQQRT